MFLLLLLSWICLRLAAQTLFACFYKIFVKFPMQNVACLASGSISLLKDTGLALDCKVPALAELHPLPRSSEKKTTSSWIKGQHGVWLELSFVYVCILL